MPSRPADLLAKTARRLAWWSALLVLAIGAVTLAGWITGVEGVSRLFPRSPRMAPNTAAVLVLLGPALLAHARPPRRRGLRIAARVAAAAATLLSAAVGAEWILGVDLGLDQLLFAVSGDAAHPGRMCPIACAALVSAGLALEADRRDLGATALGVVPLVIGLVAVAGHASGVTAFTELGGALRISLGAAVALVAVGASLLLGRPQRGLTRVLISDGPGGLIARRLLPGALLAPIPMEASRAALVSAGAFNERTGDWAFAAVLIALGIAVVISLARALDLTDVGRRAAEDRLRHSEAQARSVTDTAHDAIVGADHTGVITLFNPAAERLFGWDAAEVRGRPVTLLMPERYRAGHEAGMARLAKGAAPALSSTAGVPLELHGLTKAGREFDLELSLSHVPDGGGARVIAIMRDISPRKLLEALAREETARGARVVAAQNAIVEGAGELGPTLDIVAREARAIVGADGSVVELADGDDMVYRAAAGDGVAHLGARVPMRGSLAGAVLTDGETAICVDTETDPRVDRDACRRIGVRSMICVALRYRGRSVAVLKVFSAAPGTFSERDANTLELLAGLAAATVHRAQVERRVAALHAAGEALAGARSLEAGLAGALRGVVEQLGWALGAVWLVDDRAGTLECAESWHQPSVAAGPYLELLGTPEAPGGGGLPDVVRRAGAPIWVERADRSPDAAMDPRRAHAAVAAGLRTIAAVPIISRGQTLGVVEVACNVSRTHEAATLDLLADVAAAVGQFVQRRRAEERITIQAANLAAVSELSRLLGRSTDPAQTRPTLVRGVRDLARADSVILLEPDGAEHLVVSAEAGGLVEEGTRLHLERDAAVAIDVFRSGRGRFVGDYLDEARVAQAAQQRSGLRSAHYEPVVRDGAVAGVLVVATRELRAKDAGGVDALMRLLAGEAGTALALSDLLARLDAQARTDQLTGIANRRTWDHELPRELARARRSDEPLSLAIMDLDRFKAYNDTHGHPAGDRLLRGAAAAWAERLRATDVLARYGGEEFAVLLPGCDGASAQLVAEQLRGAVPDVETCSIGVATWDGTETAEELLGRADTALYAAKAAGRDRVVSAL
jgi:diguanylate cyclase (GGDEF)-like protein/PAS domain S-box-containing protein